MRCVHVAPRCHSYAQQQNFFASIQQTIPVGKIVSSIRRNLIFQNYANVDRELPMVGPPRHVWNVLRETDGERFVPQKKVALFLKNSSAEKVKTELMRSIWRLRIFFMRSDILSQQSCLRFEKIIPLAERKIIWARYVMDQRRSILGLQKVFRSL